MNLDLYNPLLISLLIYIPVCLLLYYSNFKIMNKENDENNENTNNPDSKPSFFYRNQNILFIIIPFILYGITCILISNRSKTNYCKYLKQKDLKIKDLLKVCKEN